MIALRYTAAYSESKDGTAVFSQIILASRFECPLFLRVEFAKMSVPKNLLYTLYGAEINRTCVQEICKVVYIRSLNCHAGILLFP